MTVKAPLRISLFGGGSDLPMFRELTGSGGCVLSCTIDQYVTAKPIAAYSDIAPGSGLGGSGAMYTALALCQNPHLSGHALFRAAWAMEVEGNRYAGWQDVAAATWGGLNLYIFDEDLTVEPIPIPPGLNERLLLFGTGITRQASEPLAMQAHTMEYYLESLRHATELAWRIAAHLVAHRLDTIGAALHEGWQEKRTLPGVTSERIDTAYTTARNAGATGGKLCGAGGGGYLLFYVEPDAQASVRQAMMGLGLDELVFNLTTEGATLL